MATRAHDTDLGTILGVWAHPDDEAYLMGGTAALAVDAGAHVACVTATLGEAGETADPERWPRHRLADVRREEMAECLAVLGIGDHRWLGHPDGGLADVPFDRGVAEVAEEVARVRPDTILTFGADGMTGHDDHRIVGEWAVAAQHAVGLPHARVLAATKTAEWHTRFPGVNADVFPDGPPTTAPHALAHEVRLEGEVLERKVRALEAQASQTSGLIAALGRDAYARWVQDEFWVRLA